MLGHLPLLTAGSIVALHTSGLWVWTGALNSLHSAEHCWGSQVWAGRRYTPGPVTVAKWLPASRSRLSMPAAGRCSQSAAYGLGTVSLGRGHPAPPGGGSWLPRLNPEPGPAAHSTGQHADHYCEAASPHLAHCSAALRRFSGKKQGRLSPGMALCVQQGTRDPHHMSLACQGLSG